MTALSVGEWLFLALGVGGFVRFGWCLVWLIGTEEPMPAWAEEALDTAVGFVLAAAATASRQATADPAPLSLLIPIAPEATR